MALGQYLQQKLAQKLSPQQIQLMKLLQIPTANLEERIKEELEENPALEIDEHAHKSEEEVNQDFEEDNAADEFNEVFDVDVSEYTHQNDDDIADYKTKSDNYDGSEAHQTIPIKNEVSFYDLLIAQLGLLNFEDNQKAIAEHIVGSIDDDGYLRRDSNAIVDDLAFRQNIITTEAVVEQLIKKIQTFEPIGICARTLPECLLIQLYKLRQDGRNVQHSIKIIEQYFEEFTKKHYDKIQKGLSLTDEELKEAIGIILKLNPKPGGNFGAVNKAETYIIPDFFIYTQNGSLELSVNSRNAPDLRISDDYREMMKTYEHGDKKDRSQKEAVLFIKQKIDAAKWFIDAIKQRQHTLLSTMNAIMNHQKEFFLTGDETSLRPMILKDIAEKINLDISTVSRVANSKFVQTEFGTFRLKFFFSEALSTDSGDEVSTREVKKVLSNIIEAESKQQPLSDEALTELLQEKGYNIARRTVAKYREQLNIPVARLRRELI